jgi:hypothetical protein
MISERRGGQGQVPSSMRCARTLSGGSLICHGLAGGPAMSISAYLLDFLTRIHARSGLTCTCTSRALIRPFQPVRRCFWWCPLTLSGSKSGGRAGPARVKAEGKQLGRTTIDSALEADS